MLRRHPRVLALVAIAAMALGACGSQSPAPTAEPPAPGGESSLDASTPPEVTSSGPSLQPLGQPFDFVSKDSNGTEIEWKVTLGEVECGLKSIPKADSNPEWDGSDSIPAYIEAKPETGNDFCVLQWDWENVGTKPGNTVFAGNILIGEEEFAPTPEDQMRSWTILETQLGVQYATTVNPHGKTKSVDIYQVPSGKQPTAVWFPETTFVNESTILVATK